MSRVRAAAPAALALLGFFEGAAAGQPPRRCPAPVCEYAGTAWHESLVGDELTVRGDARVRWVFSRMSGGEAVYVPVGWAGARWKHPRCVIGLDPAEHGFNTPSAEHGTLRVDFSRRPVRYHGTGSSGWKGQQVWNCPNGDRWVQEDDGVSTVWFSGEGVAGADGRALEGSRAEGAERGRWTFRATH